jgi:hypothetical protein
MVIISCFSSLILTRMGAHCLNFASCCSLVDFLYNPSCLEMMSSMISDVPA